jgi:16S rRNA (guanine966-N2)-methyltransferase
MRVISGQYKGRVIQMPKGIRPTQNKARKAIFDILGDIEGLSFLELCAGSGAVGLEALSHGVKEVVFVENNPECLKALRSNLSYMLTTGYSLMPLDAYAAIEKLAVKKVAFDIIFLDPPYCKDNTSSAAKKILQSISDHAILAHTGLLIAQHFKKDNLPERLGDLMLFKRTKYADTLLSFYKHE